MKSVADFFEQIIDAIDRHEGMVAMLGIAVTVLIFIREVSNNYFTMERDNFNDIFKEPVMKLLPEKLSFVNDAMDYQWQEAFDELTSLLQDILKKAEYYKYSIPFFYQCLYIRVQEIEALVGRHGESWRLYRSPAKQNRLIQKKCRLLIRNINNASKGRVLAIKCFQNHLYQCIRKTVLKQWVDRPADRLTEKYIPDELSVFNLIDGEEASIEIGNLKKIENSRLRIMPKESSSSQLIGVNCIEKGEMYFGYRLNIRWGKRIGATVVKAKRDNTVRWSHYDNGVEIRLNDNNVHKIVLMWYENNDRKHVHFKAFNIKKRYVDL